MLCKTYSCICKMLVILDDSPHQMAWFVSTFLPIHVMTHAIYSSVFVILPCILVNKLTQHLVSYQSSAESRLVIWPPERYKRSPFYTWVIRLPTWNLPLQNSFVRLRKTSAGQFTCLEVSEPCATVYSQHLAYTGKVSLAYFLCDCIQFIQARNSVLSLSIVYSQHLAYTRKDIHIKLYSINQGCLYTFIHSYVFYDLSFMCTFTNSSFHFKGDSTKLKQTSIGWNTTY